MSSLQNAPAQTQNSSLSLSFAQGFILGQLSIVLLIGAFIKFFVFGEPPSTPSSPRLSTSTTRTRAISFSTTSPPSPRKPSGPPGLRPKASSSHILRHHPTPSPSSILAKTYYNVSGHQPESLDWFNVLVAQTIAQLRADALADAAVLGSLTSLLNGDRKPSWLGEVRITEISLGEEFPIFSNARVWPMESGEEEDGTLNSTSAGNTAARDNSRGGEGRLQARMDVDLSDIITLGIETTMVLNYPRPRVAVLPIALSVSVARFSGTLSISFLPASTSPSPSTSVPQPPHTTLSPSTPTNQYPPFPHPHPPPFRSPMAPPHQPPQNDPPTQGTPTTLSLTFSPHYTLSLSTRSLLGSRSRLQDIPKIAQIIEAQLRAWFEERCVAPRVQRIVVPSLWPRMRNVVDVGGKGERGDGNGKMGNGEVPGGTRDGSDVREEASGEVLLESEGKGEGDDGLRRRGFGGEQRGWGRHVGGGGGASTGDPPGAREREAEWGMPGPMPGTLVS